MEMVPSHLLKMEVADNRKLQDEIELLHREMEELKRKNQALRNLLVGLHDRTIEVDRSDNYVRGNGRKPFKPAYKDEADIDNVVRIIYEENTTDFNKIAAKLGVSHSTIRRRLKNNKMYPIDKEQIQTHYILFCKKHDD